VGNGLATEAGPAHDHGRIKKPPYMELGPYYDDSELKFPDVPPRPISSKGGIRVNVSAVKNFVETMLTRSTTPSVSSNVEKRRDSNDPSVISSRTSAKVMTTHLHQTWRNPDAATMIRQSHQGIM
jgi:hypothetical protein